MTLSHPKKSYKNIPKKLKFLWLMFADYMIKKSVSTCSVLFHDVVLAFFLMGFGKSILLPISTEKKERGTTCNIQPVKNHHQNFRAKNLFQFFGRNRPFFAWQTSVFGVSWEKSRNILQKSAQFSYKTFRSLGLLNERTLNSFPKILLLADMGINLGFLGFLLVLIPSEVWGVNMDRWIFRPPPCSFCFSNGHRRPRCLLRMVWRWWLITAP